MTSDQRKALRSLARAVRDGEAALEVIRAAQLDAVAPVTSLAEKLRELREVNERRKALMRTVRDELVVAGVDELKRPAGAWRSCATIGAQVSALLGD